MVAIATTKVAAVRDPQTRARDWKGPEAIEGWHLAAAWGKRAVADSAAAWRYVGYYSQQQVVLDVTASAPVSDASGTVALIW